MYVWSEYKLADGPRVNLRPSDTPRCKYVLGVEREVLLSHVIIHHDVQYRILAEMSVRSPRKLLIVIINS